MYDTVSNLKLNPKVQKMDVLNIIIIWGFRPSYIFCHMGWLPRIRGLWH